MAAMPVLNGDIMTPRLPATLTLCFLMAAGATAAAPASAVSDCTRQARSILQSLQAGDFHAARRGFGNTLKSTLSTTRLEHVWTTLLPAQAGRFDHAATARPAHTVGDATVVVIPLKFDHAWLKLQVACAADGKVTGLYFKPGHAPRAH